MDDQRIRLLQAMPFFGGVSEEVLALLLERVKPVFVAKGEYFFREGNRGASAFILEEGRVSILKGWRGRSYFLRHLEAGDCIGEVALMDFSPRSASVLADEDCRAIELSTADLHQVASKSLEQFAMIYMNIGRELSRRLREADERAFRHRVEAGDITTALPGHES